MQAIGGRRAIGEMRSLFLHGVIRLPNGRPAVEVELATSDGGKVLGVMSFIGLGQSRFGSDGNTAWEENYRENQDPSWTLIDQATLSQKVQQINWLEWFTMLPSSLNRMELEGETTFDGEQCWQISIQEEGEKKQFAFFSIATHRPRGRRSIESTPNGDTTVDIYFRNWQRVENLVLFHTVIYSREGNDVTLLFDRIEIGSVDDSIFELPIQVSKLKDQS